MMFQHSKSMFRSAPSNPLRIGFRGGLPNGENSSNSSTQSVRKDRPNYTSTGKEKQPGLPNFMILGQSGCLALIGHCPLSSVVICSCAGRCSTPAAPLLKYGSTGDNELFGVFYLSNAPSSQLYSFGQWAMKENNLSKSING